MMDRYIYNKMRESLLKVREGIVAQKVTESEQQLIGLQPLRHLQV
jgi:hypothetical protein